MVRAAPPVRPGKLQRTVVVGVRTALAGVLRPHIQGLLSQGVESVDVADWVRYSTFFITLLTNSDTTRYSIVMAYKSEDMARAAAQTVHGWLKQDGGWTTEVWENLGWHFNLVRYGNVAPSRGETHNTRTLSLSQHLGYPDGLPRYSCLIGYERSGLTHLRCPTTLSPNDAVAEATKVLDAHIAEMQALRSECIPT